jgi:hypothetical protein
METLKTFESFKSVLRFGDLSDEAKANAIENARDINVDLEDWADPIIEGFVENMNEAGISDVEVEYSGFWSQGDGACFTGVVRGEEDKITLITKELGMNVYPEVIENIYIRIAKNSGRYSHSRTMNAEVEVDGDDEIELDMGTGLIIPINIQDQCELIQARLEEWARGKADELYDKLEKSYDDLCSDEAVSQCLIANEYEYDEEGNII